MSDAPLIDIQLNRLSKVYQSKTGKVKAIDDISFSVNRGEILCIVGMSGCGKTTILKILLGLIEPTSGTVHIDKDRKAQGTAYIQQNAALLPWRTVLQNAAIGHELRGHLSKATISGIKARLDDVGLGGFEHKMVRELSGGMRQTLDLVRALESGPKLLFCDEPFSAIDFVSRFRLNTQFRYLCKVGGCTVVFVTHNIQEALFLGDQIVVLGRHPSEVIFECRPNLSVHPEDALKCQESEEFHPLFLEIWKHMQNE